MKSQFAALSATLLSVAIGSASATVITSYEFVGAAGNETSVAPTFTTPNVTASPMSRGPGVTPTSASGAFSGSGWTSGSNLDINDYFSFSVSPVSGYTLSLTQLMLDERRSSTGIRNWSVRSSLDGFASDLAVFTVPDDTATRDQTIGLSGAFAALAGPVEFRVYGYASEAAGGTWRIDNVELQGALNAATTRAVPDTLPGAFAATAILGVLLAGRPFSPKART